MVLFYFLNIGVKRFLKFIVYIGVAFSLLVYMSSDWYSPACRFWWGGFWKVLSSKNKIIFLMLLLLTLQKIWCNWLLDQYSCLFFLKIFSRIFIFNLLTYLLFFLTSHRLAMIFPSLWGLFYWTNSCRSAVIFPYAFFSGLCIWYLHSKGTAYSGL